MDKVVFSSSAIAAFKRCPKSFQLGYEMGLEPSTTIKQYVHDGSSFHAIMAAESKGESWGDVFGGDMLDVAAAYLRARPRPENRLMIEEPLYTLLAGPSNSTLDWYEPDIYIRTTFDLVYQREDGTIVGRDYKTFEKSPTLDLDLDFQGRVYVAALQRRYPECPVEFEYEYVRRVPPGTKNSKGFWTPQDCYLTFPLVISKREADAVWEETQWVAEAMLQARERNRYWRTDLKGSSPFTCGSCFYRDLCKAELEHGELTDQDLAILAPTRKEPIDLPA